MPDITNSSSTARIRVGRSFLSVWKWAVWDMRVNLSSICVISWVSRNKRPPTSSMRWRKQLSIVATRSSQLGIKSVENRSHRWMYRSWHNHLLSAEQGVYKSKKKKKMKSLRVECSKLRRLSFSYQISCASNLRHSCSDMEEIPESTSQWIRYLFDTNESSVVLNPHASLFLARDHTPLEPGDWR